MKRVLTAIFIITASGANAVGQYVTTALPNGNIVITDSYHGKIRTCSWEDHKWDCTKWQTIE